MSHPAPPSGAPTEEQLESWKEIAAYLGKGVRTVVRWEKTEGLPVHRHLHERRSSVFAYRTEIDEWWRNRRAALDHERPTGQLFLRKRWIWLTIPVAAAVLAVWLLAPFSVPPSEGPLTFEPLTSYPGAQFAPGFSPDGSHFAFVWGGWNGDNMDVYVQAVGSADPKRLTSHPWLDFSPVWSPDGMWIAFLRRSPQFQIELLLIPSLGGAERKLADLRERHFMDATQLSWSSDGKWLAFADIDSGGPGLFRLAPDTGERRRLTNGPGPRGDLDPSYSPDGRQIAFRRGATESHSEIYLQPLAEDGEPNGEPERLTRQGVRTTSPVWSGDGRYLFFSSGIFGTGLGNVYRIQVNPRSAGPPQRLTASQGEAHFSLAASWRGGLLATTRGQVDLNIWRVEQAGEDWEAPEPIPLLSSTRSEYDPAFSPDGRQIAFVSDRSGPLELWVSERDGSDTRKLTSFGTGYISSPRWSPDGRWIVFSRLWRDTYGVWTIDVGGGPPRQVVEPGWSPSWSRDGHWIYYSSASQNPQIFKVPADGGAAQQVVDTAERAAALRRLSPAENEAAPYRRDRRGWEVGNMPNESPDGRYLLFTGPGGVWRSPVAGGPSEPVVQGDTPYAVCSDGVFLHGPFDPAIRRRPLLYYRFADGVTLTVTHTGAGPYPHGLAAAADCKTVLYSQIDRESTNLMFVRGVW